MPLPKPHKGQSKKEFISVCMGNPTMNKEWKNTPQRYAICLSLEKKRHKKAKGSESVEEILDWEDVEKQIEKDGAIII